MVVQLDGDGHVMMTNGFYYPGIQVSTTPSLSASQAIRRGKTDLGLNNPSGESNSAELVIFLQDNGSFTLAWKTIVFAEEPFTDWLYYINAHSGEILYKLNQLTNVNGDGDIYPTHPGLSSVNNKTLYRLSGNGRLQGTYADIENDEASEAYSGSNSFVYSSSNTHFDEVNLYYHVDQFRHNFIENVDNGSLGFT